MLFGRTFGLDRPRFWAAAGLLWLAACADQPAFTVAGAEAQALADRIAELLMTGDTHGAFEAANQALVVYPKARALHEELAHAAVATNRPALAIETWQALLAETTDPTERHALNQSIGFEALTHGLVELGADAIAELRTAPEPSAADLLLMSLDAFERGALDEALDAAQIGAAMDPRDATLAYQVARLELALGRDSARAALERTIELDPGQDRAHFNLGQLAMERGDDAAAEVALASQARIRQLTKQSFSELPPKARQQLASEIASDMPTWSIPLIEIAQAQLELGQPRKAQETLERAREAQPFSVRIIELSYAAARARGQEKDARMWLQRWRSATNQTYTAL
jgi:predicted Zn-dependent protease